MNPNEIEKAFRPIFTTLFNQHFEEVQRSTDMNTSHSALNEAFGEGNVKCKVCLKLDAAEVALKFNWDNMVIPGEISPALISLPSVSMLMASL